MVVTIIDDGDGNCNIIITVLEVGAGIDGSF